MMDDLARSYQPSLSFLSCQVRRFSVLGGSWIQPPQAGKCPWLPKGVRIPLTARDAALEDSRSQHGCVCRAHMRSLVAITSRG